MPERGPSGQNDTQSVAVDAVDRLWLDIAHGVAKESINSVEGAAKQVIGITSALQALYFAVISFGDLRRMILSAGIPNRWFTIAVFLAPPAVWVLSLAFAALCFSPKPYRTNLRSPDLAERFYRDIVQYKHRQLVRSYSTLLIGFILVLANAFGYLYLSPLAK
jgi:hypothetical protein